MLYSSYYCIISNSKSLAVKFSYLSKTKALKRVGIFNSKMMSITLSNITCEAS